jgi:hypothetical protein
MHTEFSKLCTPAKIYFAIAVVASIFALFKGVRVMAVAMKLFFAFIWTFVLGWLCEKGLKTVSWFLVLLPYILIAVMMLQEKKQIDEGLRGNKSSDSDCGACQHQ